jgi:RNA polymerase sigma factor (sigma-70 family)
MASGRPTTTMVDQLGTLYSLGAVGSLPDDRLVEIFLARDDRTASEAAFSVLVDRHGAMVLSVCQRVLQNPHDAHDAFQATFLVLVRKAASIRRRDSVGGWLFGIARRVAVRARLEAARRRQRLEKLGTERQNSNDDAMAIATEPEPDYGPLIAEIDRLPERFRAPIVLHYFEGLSAEAAAERLGCPRGTILSRLARARERLRRRLEHRGVALEALMPATLNSGRLFSSAMVPSSLVQSTVRAASCLALAGTAIESVVPANVATLSSGVVRNLMFAKVKVALVLVILGMASATIGLSMAAHVDQKRRPADSERKTVSKQVNDPQPVAAPRVKENPKGAPVAIKGQVLGPWGNPIAGAQILLGLPDTEPGTWTSPRRLAISGADGRFEVALPGEAQGLSGARGTDRPAIAAVAPGFGSDWIKIDPEGAGNGLTLRLRRDDVPIDGRLTGLEGRPLPDLTVYAAYLMELPAGFLKKLTENAGQMNPGLWGEMRNSLILGKEGPISPVRTGSDGRFHLTGVGCDRGVLLLIEGESVEQSFAMVYTSSDPAYIPPILPSDGSGERKLFGPRFELTVAPGRVIEGVIRDTDSGRPVSGVKVRSWAIGVTTSDAQGRFRIPGQPKRSDNIVEVTTEGRPYIKVDKLVGDPPGLGPIRVDVALKRGVWVEGKVTNGADGRPVRAIVQYYPMRDNPHLKECPDASFLDNNVSDEAEFPTDANGRFRAVTLPGGGILTVRTVERNFLTAKPLSPKDAGNVLHAANFDYQMKQYEALVPINVGDAETVTIPDIVVTRGRTQHVKVVGPDGKPVAATRLFSNLIQDLSGEPSSGAEFTFVHPDPDADEAILVVNQDETAGTLLTVKGNEPDPIAITLQTAGTVTGRLVDEEGRPRPNVPFVVMQDLKTTRFERLSVQPPTGPDGRFRISGLIPGVSYNVDAIKNNTTNYSERFLGSIGKGRWTIMPGETQNWGDVQVKKYRP